MNDRTREIGVRVALGARASDVRGLVLRQGLGMTLGGLAVGVAGSLALMRVMSGLLFEVSPADPLTYAGASALIVLAALAGCYLPARRAAGVDPVVALRCE